MFLNSFWYFCFCSSALLLYSLVDIYESPRICLLFSVLRNERVRIEILRRKNRRKRWMKVRAWTDIRRNTGCTSMYIGQRPSYLLQHRCCIVTPVGFEPTMQPGSLSRRTTTTSFDRPLRNGVCWFGRTACSCLNKDYIIPEPQYQLRLDF